MHFVLVTNGWRRSDLNIYAGDSHPPQPLRYLALGEWGAGFLLGGEFQVTPWVHRWSLVWEPSCDAWEEVGSWVT